MSLRPLGGTPNANTRQPRRRGNRLFLSTTQYLPNGLLMRPLPVSYEWLALLLGTCLYEDGALISYLTNVAEQKTDLVITLGLGHRMVGRLVV